MKHCDDKQYPSACLMSQIGQYFTHQSVKCGVNEDDSRERAAHVHLNKSQLNQYCTALAMRTLGIYIYSVEVEETELIVLRRTGGTAVFVISRVHVCRCRIKNMHLWFVFMNVDTFVRSQKCRAAKETNAESWLNGRS